jgi:hypothetical protein
MTNSKLLVIAAVVPLLFMFARQAHAAASNIYYAQTAQGNNNGADCADAYAYTDATNGFNVSSKWGSGSSQIGPGTTVHLCGTITASAGASALLWFQGAGTSGNPITLRFEPGAILQAPYWGSLGAIYCSNEQYVTVDGGTNGVLQATANGTDLTYQAGGPGIVFRTCNNFVIQNLTVADIYVHDSVSNTNDTNGSLSDGISVTGGDGGAVQYNTVHDAHWCIAYGTYSGTTGTNYTIAHNVLYNCDHDVAGGDGNVNTTQNGVYIHDNTTCTAGGYCGGWGLWDTTSNTFHHDCIHYWSTHTGSVLNNLEIYNNTCKGDPGGHMSAFIYAEGSDYSGEGSVLSPLVFNNIVVNTSLSDSPGDGMIFFFAENPAAYNNTVMGSLSAAISLYGVNSTSGDASATVENNIMSGTPTGIYLQNNTNGTTTYYATLAASDHNEFYNVQDPGMVWGSSHTYNTLTAWQGCSETDCPSGGPDLHSNVSNPNLSTSYQLQAGSGAIGLGANLSSLAVSQLDFDFAGLSRPSSGAWDAGAYQYSASGAQSLLIGGGALIVGLALLW